MNQENCLFCKIVLKKIPSAVVYEGDEVLGFKDVNPQAPVHYLFVPKRHLGSVSQVTTTENPVGLLVLAATHCARELKMDSTGYRLVMNHGHDGGQTVEHLHLHLLGGRSMKWPPG